MMLTTISQPDRFEDPLSRALRPPPDETPEQREERMDAQRLAKERSRRIDERIAEDRRAYERKRHAVKILLLGASAIHIARVMSHLRRRVRI